jgi:hypothetical protein
LAAKPVLIIFWWVWQGEEEVCIRTYFVNFVLTRNLFWSRHANYLQAHLDPADHRCTVRTLRLASSEQAYDEMTLVAIRGPKKAVLVAPDISR